MFMMYFIHNVFTTCFGRYYGHLQGDIIIIIFSFLQGIYTYIPETNHVPRAYIVAHILSLLFMVPISPVIIIITRLQMYNVVSCVAATP
jgi:hypothetical protein